MASADCPKIVQPTGTATTGLWHELPLPLRECGEIAVLRLSSALSESLIQAADHLFDEATQALTPHEREAFMDAAEFARQHRHGMVYDFMKHFEHRYLRACRTRPNALLAHDIDFDVRDLKIVEHHMLDDSLEPGKITEAIQNSCWKTLQALTSQFRDLMDCEDLMPKDLPLGPRVIEGAIADAIRDQPWRHKAKHRLANALRWGLAARVNLLYHDLTDLLSARDLRSFSAPEEGDGPVEETPPPAAVPSGDSRPAPMPTEKGSTQRFEGAHTLEDAAAEAAQREVARCVGTAILPQSVVEFLSTHWQDHLAATFIHQGEGSRSWRDAVATMDDLAWTLSAKTDGEAFLRQKESLPGLLKRLNQGLDAIELAQPLRDRFFVLLLQAHGDAVQRSIACLSPPPAVAAATDADTGQAGPVTEGKAAPADVPVLPHPAQPQTPQPPQAQTGPAGGADTNPVDSGTGEDSILADSKVGAWFECMDAQGQVTELKLAWISPHRSLFLLTNRKGERALSLMAEELAARMRAGSARLVRPAGDPGNGKPFGHKPSSTRTA